MFTDIYIRPPIVFIIRALEPAIAVRQSVSAGYDDLRAERFGRGTLGQSFGTSARVQGLFWWLSLIRRLSFWISSFLQKNNSRNSLRKEKKTKLERENKSSGAIFPTRIYIKQRSPLSHHPLSSILAFTSRQYCISAGDTFSRGYSQLTCVMWISPRRKEPLDCPRNNLSYGAPSSWKCKYWPTRLRIRCIWERLYYEGTQLFSYTKLFLMLSGTWRPHKSMILHYGAS